MNHCIHSSTTKRKRGPSRLLLGLALLGLVGVATGAVAVSTDREKDASAGILNLQETSKAFAHVTKKVSPAVVYIQVEKQVPGMTSALRGNERAMPEEWLKEFFGDRWKGQEFRRPEMPRGEQRSVGQGSGFIISQDGYILTNNHVVSGADKLTVTLADGREFAGTMVGSDARSDVAVIKIDAKRLPQLHLGNSDAADVGEWVLAIGSPFGLPGTVTSGIVSAKGRNSVGITDYENFIQTDAAINPGNSGGPLVNLHGEVIGINTAIFSRSGANNGIGFAIPINMARNICDQLIEEGAVTRGYLGILLQKLTPELASSFGLEQHHGVLVGDVTDDSPAGNAGVLAGDVVVEFNGKAVSNIGEFRNMVAATEPEAEVEMVVMRDGKRTALSVTVGRLAGSKSEAVESQPDSVEQLGFRASALDDAQRERYGWQDRSGVVVSDVDSGSAAALAGLRPGMLIEEINRSPVSDMETFRSLMSEGKDSERLLLRVRDGEMARYIVLSWKSTKS